MPLELSVLEEFPPADLKDFKPDRSLDEIRKSIFLIETEKGTGTGWMIDDHTIATDYHVIRNARQICAVTENGRRYRLGAQVAFDTKNDLALLTFVGEAPEGAKPLNRGLATSLAPGSNLYSLGHARGGPARWFSGTFDGMTTHRDWLKLYAERGDRQDKLHADWALRHHSDADLNLPLSVGEIPVTNGCSGGPIFNERGEVVSIVRLGIMGDPSKEFSTPSEKVRDLYDGRYDGSRFELRTGARETGFYSYLRTAENRPGEFALDNAAMFFAARGGVKLTSFNGLDPMNLISARSAVRNGVVAGAVLGVRTVMDAHGLYRSPDNLDTCKYSLALASDGLMAGGLGRSLSMLKTGSAGRVGKLLLLGGLAGRIACEFIPSNFAVEIGNQPFLP